jgi:hypothetical protein
MNQNIVIVSFLVIGFAFVVPLGIALVLTTRKAWTPDRKAALTVSLLLALLASPLLNIAVTHLPGFLSLAIVVLPLVGLVAFTLRCRTTYIPRHKVALIGSFTVALALNPWFQVLFLGPILEPLDDRLNYAFRDHVAQLDIVGKTPEDILALVGKPGSDWTDTPQMLDGKGNVTWTGETYRAWEYHQLPLYWFGSKFQIFFKDGRVSNWEANDD